MSKRGRFDSSSRRRSRHGEVWALAPWLAVAFASPAVAQQSQARGIVRDVKDMQAEAAATPLPDVDAIERGENPPASASFVKNRKRGATVAASAQGGAANDTPATLSVAQTGDEGGAAFEDEGASGGDGEASARPVPELHSVEAGDTLWSLCKSYFNDPYKWPQLWALNPLVTNPHWIFPGDVIRLRNADGDAEVGDPSGDAAAPQLVASRAGALSGSVMLRETGFVESDALRAAGKLTGSREEKIMLTTGDQTYVGFPEKKPLRAGERYTVFTVDTEQPVMDPQGEKVLGYLVRIHGDLVLDQIADKGTGRGTLIDAVGPIERGYFVSNQVKQFKRISPRPSQVNIEARVVASFAPINMLSADNFVVLSRGASDGIEVGNRTFVIRRGDGYAPLMEGWEQNDDRYPKEVVAEMLVVDVHDKTSVAWIARSTKEIRIGETTETRKGY